MRLANGLQHVWRTVGTVEFQPIPMEIVSPEKQFTVYLDEVRLPADALVGDPDAGLATIEAIYAAYTHLGWATDGLLADYYWADEFLALNQEFIKSVPT